MEEVSGKDLKHIPEDMLEAECIRATNVRDCPTANLHSALVHVMLFVCPLLRMEIVICLIILLVTHKFGTRPNVVAFGWVQGCITIIATRTFPLNPLIRYPVLKLVQTALPHVRRRRGT